MLMVATSKWMLYRLQTKGGSVNVWWSNLSKGEVGEGAGSRGLYYTMNCHPNSPPEGRSQRTCLPNLRPCILNTPPCLLLGYLRSWPHPAHVASNFSLLYTCGRHVQPSGWACQCGHLQPPHLLRIIGQFRKVHHILSSDRIFPAGLSQHPNTCTNHLLCIVI